MATIKEFKGKTPPKLKKGELATDGDAIYLLLENGKIEKFIHKKRIHNNIDDKIREHVREYHT